MSAYHSKHWYLLKQTWNATYHKIFNKSKSITKDACMKLILWWNKAIIHRDRCICSWTGSCPTTNVKWYNFPLSSMEKRDRNIEREALGTLYTQKFHHYSLMRQISIIRSQTTSCNIQKRCNKTITGTTVISTQNTPIQSQNYIQVWTRSIHSWLALQKKKPQGKQTPKYLTCS